MSRRNVVEFLTAPARSGKSFRMVVRICDEILPNGEGIVYTNLPLYPEKIADHCALKHGLDRESVLARIHIIPREIEHAWKEAGMPIYDGTTGRKLGTNSFDGPWNYFADKELSGATIIIDEIHNFCGSIGTPKAISNNWQKWLGELGHNQAIFLCISQAPEKVHACIKQEAGASYVIRNTGLDRDPYFKIELYDWFELWSGLFGRPYRIFVFEQELQKSEGRRVKGQRKLTLMGPPYFDYYDSFNKPIASEQTANLNPFEHEYEKHLRKGALRGRLSLLRWFFVKNLQPLIGRGLMAVAMISVLIFLSTGGAGEISRMISDTVSGGVKKKSAANAEKPKEADATQAVIIEKETLENVTKDEKDKIERIRVVYEEELRKALTEKEKLSAEKEKLSTEAEQTKQELEKLTEEIERQSALVLITPDNMVLQGGYAYEIGEEIRNGKYKGRLVKDIDYRRREATLDDDSVLSLAP
jgi:Chromosome segregation ATPases